MSASGAGAPSGRPSPPSTASASRRPPECRPGGNGRRPPPPPSRFRPFRLALGPRAAAGALAAALALLLGAGAAQAQTSIKLVGNTGQGGGSALVPATLSQQFTTGTNVTGYKLTHVNVRLARPGAPTFTFSIHSDSSGSPGASLGTLTNPTNLGSSLQNYTFTASGGGIDLAADTKYFVKFTSTGSSHSTSLQLTSSDNEDADGLPDWRIADRASFGQRSLMMAIHGYANPSSAVTGRSLTIPLDRAIDARKCPVPRAFSMTASGTVADGTAYETAYVFEYPRPFVYVGCKERSLRLTLSRYLPPIREGGGVHLRYRRGIPEGSTVTVSYDKALAHAGGTRRPTARRRRARTTPRPRGR